jgi:hypothetical protein
MLLSSKIDIIYKIMLLIRNNNNFFIRNNIIFGTKFDESAYNKVISSCALKTDLEILPAGDLTGNKSFKLVVVVKNYLKLKKSKKSVKKELIYLVDKSNVSGL